MGLALKESQFSLNYQPFVDAATLELVGFEALLRWDHPSRGLIPAVDFIPIAEDCGLIVPIGSWVLATACAEAVSWDKPLGISVNLSPAQFLQPGIVGTVAAVLRQTGLLPKRLELEVTEGTLMGDTQNALTALKALGVKIAMDDFGAGYSSLSYLRKFSFDKLKIDRSFIGEVEDNPEAETIVQAIIAMSRSLRLTVTAEGVETKQQLAMLQAQGCDFVQGYLLCRPRSADLLGMNPPGGATTCDGQHNNLLGGHGRTVGLNAVPIRSVARRVAEWRATPHCCGLLGGERHDDGGSQPISTSFGSQGHQACLCPFFARQLVEGYQIAWLKAQRVRPAVRSLCKFAISY